MDNEEEKVLDGENATEDTVVDTDVEEASPTVEEDSTLDLDEDVADEAPADSEEGVA